MSTNTLMPVVLCGGSGTRLWPLSRRQNPKQFIKLFGDRSPFQEAVVRARELEPARWPVIVGNEAHRFLILDALAELGAHGADILLEPVGRNTAPALAAAALHAVKSDGDAVLLAMPADQHIADNAKFAAAVKRGLPAARSGAIVTFGITPAQAHTGYGYIRKGAKRGGAGVYAIAAFKEKPDAATAAQYLADGGYLWNSGIFLVRADAYLRMLEQAAPDIAEAAGSAYAAGQWNGAALQLDGAALSACRSESIDRAVMEHTHAGVTVTLDTRWCDLGTWSSLRQATNGDAGNNAVHGDVLLDDVQDCVVHSSDRLVAALGLRGQVIVDTPDAVFVAPLERAQEVQRLVGRLERQGREEADVHLRVHRPWGWYERLARDDGMQVKLIEVNPGASLSLQMHRHRSEHWVVVEGEAEVTRGDAVFTLREHESTDIPVKTRHRLRNRGTAPLRVIEVQRGSYLGEDDIVRFVDTYGRAAQS